MENNEKKKLTFEETEKLKREKYDSKMEQIDFSEIPTSNTEEIYLLTSLQKLLQVYGPSKEEGEVLAFLETEIRKVDDFKDLVLVKDEKSYGFYVIVPPKNGKVKHTILFDAHVDTVMKKYMEPLYFLEDLKRKKRVIVKATGLDNRLNCALLLSMVKFCRFDDIQYIALFSTEEEIGMWGVKNFSKSVNVIRDHDIEKLDLIVVLDVHPGVLKVEASARSKIIGEGMYPQGLTTFRTRNEDKSACNAQCFGGIYKKVYITSSYACGCCFMHSFSSYASISDLFELFQFFRTKMMKTVELEKINEVEDREKEAVLEVKKKEKQKKEEERQVKKLNLKRKEIEDVKKQISEVDKELDGEKDENLKKSMTSKKYRLTKKLSRLMSERKLIQRRIVQAKRLF